MVVCNENYQAYGHIAGIATFLEPGVNTDIVVTIDWGRHLTGGYAGGVGVGHQRAAASSVVSVQGSQTVAQLLQILKVQS